MRKLSLVVLLLAILFISFNLLFPTPALAVCPVCTVIVIAGLGISRALGIDDIVTSIWIGGLILSMSFWLIDWVQKKKWLGKIKNKKTVSLINFSMIILMYLLVLIPLKLDHSIGIIRNKLWGIDKVILGTGIGSIAFLIGMWIDKKIRKVKGEQLFIFQKVVFPVLGLIISSLVFYFLTRK
jgi:hypothetical protein